MGEVVPVVPNLAMSCRSCRIWPCRAGRAEIRVSPAGTERPACAADTPADASAMAPACTVPSTLNDDAVIMRRPATVTWPARVTPPPVVITRLPGSARFSRVRLSPGTAPVTLICRRLAALPAVLESRSPLTKTAISPSPDTATSTGPPPMESSPVAASNATGANGAAEQPPLFEPFDPQRCVP